MLFCLMSFLQAADEAERRDRSLAAAEVITTLAQQLLVPDDQVAVILYRIQKPRTILF